MESYKFHINVIFTTLTKKAKRVDIFIVCTCQVFLIEYRKPAKNAHVKVTIEINVT